MEIDETNVNSLSTLGVHDLRNIARSFGVSSPTTKKKTELIAEIISKKESKAPVAETNKKGRKPTNKILSSFLPNTSGLTNLAYESLQTERIGFHNFETKLYFGEPRALRCFLVQGVLQKQGNQHYFFARDEVNSHFVKIVMIDNQFVEDNDLEIGDMVLGVAHETIQRSFFKFMQYKSKNHELLKKENDLAETMQRSIPFLNTSFLMGQRIVIKNDALAGFEKLFDEINKIKHNFDKVVMVCADIHNDLDMLLEKSDYLNFITLFGEAHTKTCEAFRSGTNHIEKLAELGCNVLALYFNITQVKRAYRKVFERNMLNTNEAPDERAENEIKFEMTCGPVRDGGTVTSMFVFGEFALSTDYVQTSFLESCNLFVTL